jgi:hypothetical protein
MGFYSQILMANYAIEFPTPGCLNRFASFLIFARVQCTDVGGRAECVKKECANDRVVIGGGYSY